MKDTQQLLDRLAGGLNLIIRAKDTRIAALEVALRHLVTDFDDGDASGDSSVMYDVEQGRRVLADAQFSKEAKP